MKAFVPNERPTLGVEEEFQLIDPIGGDLRELELELARRTITFDRPF